MHQLLRHVNHQQIFGSNIGHLQATTHTHTTNEKPPQDF